MTKIKIGDIRHPSFDKDAIDWFKYRLVYEGGKCFVNRYLEKLSTRESAYDFNCRKNITYSPSFAKSAINEVKNVIFNRLRDVVRQSVSNTYTRAINGELKGVDNAGSTMDYFIGLEILPQLLTMRKVGVYVDMPSTVPTTLAEKKRNTHPYVYMYPAESILSWTYAPADDPREFASVLLYEDNYVYDNVTNLPCGKMERNRYLYIENDKVYVEFYNKEGEQTDTYGNLNTEPIELNIPEIPFVVFEISDSLLKDVADYQIALLNMESADIAYAISSNFPLYIEQQDDDMNSAEDLPAYTEETPPTDAQLTEAKDATAKVGVKYGRKYPKGANEPAFIYPSPEPLMAAMDKEKQIKKDIKLLMNLTVNDLSDKMVSADSKAADESGKQTGLACIAYVLECGEQKIANFWNYYESVIDDNAKIVYPKDYELKSDEQRVADCTALWELLDKIPSNTFKKVILKKIIATILNGRVNVDIINTINKEIDDAQVLVSSVEDLVQLITIGVVDKVSASEAVGIAKGIAEKAKKEHTEELAEIQASQGGIGGDARGVPATQGTQPSSGDEKAGKAKRGAS